MFYGVGGEAMKENIDNLNDDKEEREKKMQMSYDSGLNSIENESMLDEDDESWMQTQNHKTELPAAKSAKNG